LETATSDGPLASAWPTYHGDNSRRGLAAGSPDPAHPRVIWRAGLDGPAYASPLVVGGFVIEATTGGTVYALDAGTGAVRWRTHLADPVPGSTLPCGNIDRLGVVGTPVYDRASGTVFAVAMQAGPKHVLYGLNARTGAIRIHRDIDPAGIDPATHLQRAALAVAGGRVYVAYGENFGDCGQYQGRVVAVATSGAGPMLTFAVPTTREAGIWGASGPAVTAGGEIVVTTGNGEATGGTWDHSDSVLRLSPTLKLLDGFAPTGWAQENSVDADLGSTGPLLLDDGRALAAGKGGSIYLVDVSHLGGVGGQLAALQGCRSFGGMAAGGKTAAGTPVFVPCVSGVQQVIVGSGNTLRRGWQAPPQVAGSPVVVGSTVWSLEQAGTLDAMDAATGARRASVPVGPTTRFATPAVAGSRLYVPTLLGVTAVAIR
jgi:outer membrane protein assembly factor BamB